MSLSSTVEAIRPLPLVAERTASEVPFRPRVTAILEDTIRRVPGATIFACIDLDQGVIVEHASRGRVAAPALDMLAASVWELFDSDGLLTIEKLWRQNDCPELGSTRKMIVASESHIHIVLRGGRLPRLAVVVVCGAEVKMGLALACCQDALHEIEAIA